MKNLIDAIDFTKTKLLIIGDNAQLPSVGCGNVLHDLMQTNIIPIVTLTKIFRYSEGGLMKVATDVRLCEQYLTKDMKGKMTSFGNNKDYTFIDVPDDKITMNIVALYKKLLSLGKTINDIQVLTSKNIGDCGAIMLNNAIQKVANPNYDSQSCMIIGKDETQVTYYVGDLVIQKANNYKALMSDENGDEIYESWDVNQEEPCTAFIANGEIGVIKDIYQSYVILDFDGTLIKYYKDDMNVVGLGYAISIHKCLTDDTYIYTNKGIIQLQELIIKSTFDKNGYADTPDDLLVYNGTNLEKPSKLIDNGVEDCKTIITKKGYHITGTYTHGLDVIDKEGNIVRKNIGDITTDDFLVISKGQEIFGKKIDIPSDWYNFKVGKKAIRYNLPQEITEDFAEFLGYLFADGTIHKNGSIVRFGKNQKEVVERFVELTNNIFKYKNNIGIKHMDGVQGGFYFYEINSYYITNFLKNINGIQPNKKFVPKCIMEAPKNIQTKFLKGAFEDGTVNLKKDKFDHIELSLKDEYAIEQIKILLLNLGICCSVKKRSGQPYTIYSLYIYRRYAQIFKDLIGFTSYKKINRLKLCDGQIKCANESIPYILNIIIKLRDKYNLKLKDCSQQLVSYTHKNCNCKFNGLTTSMLKTFIDYYDSTLKNDKDFNYLKFLLNNCFIDRVTSIENVVEHTYCLEMPHSHKFVQNGIYGWNSQGGSANTIILATPKSHTFMLNSNLVYVGLTRMKEKCFHLGNLYTVNTAIQKKANLTRSTFMQRLLIDMYNGIEVDLPYPKGIKIDIDDIDNLIDFPF